MSGEWSGLIQQYYDAIRLDDACDARAYGARRHGCDTHLQVLHKSRQAEKWRKEWQNEARLQAKAMGYDGTLVLRRGDKHYTMELSRDPVVSEIRLSRPVLVGSSLGGADEVVGRAVDLAILSRRRRRAIEDQGHHISAAPDWAFLGHPVARAFHEFMRPRSIGAEPRTTMADWYGEAAGIAQSEFRIVTQGARIDMGGTRIKLHATENLARLRMDAALPETVIAALKGRPLHQVIGLSGLMPGTTGGDALIQSVHGDLASTTIMVECALMPMGDAPKGVDTSFLEEWWKRHGN